MADSVIVLSPGFVGRRSPPYYATLQWRHHTGDGKIVRADESWRRGGGSGERQAKNFSKNYEKGLGKPEKVLHNSQSIGALAQLVEQRTLNP